MKFDPETAASVIALLRSGARRKTIFEIAGIDRTTFWRWRDRGRRDRALGRDTEFARFFQDTEEAEGQVAGKVEHAFTREAMSGRYWRASLKWLERRRPEEWAERPTEAVRQELCAELIEIVRAGSSHEFFGQFMQVLIDWGRAHDDREMVELAAGSRQLSAEIDIEEGDDETAE